MRDLTATLGTSCLFGTSTKNLLSEQDNKLVRVPLLNSDKLLSSTSVEIGMADSQHTPSRLRSTGGAVPEVVVLVCGAYSPTYPPPLLSFFSSYNPASFRNLIHRGLVTGDSDLGGIGDLPINRGAVSIRKL